MTLGDGPSKQDRNYEQNCLADWLCSFCRYNENDSGKHGENAPNCQDLNIDWGGLMGIVFEILTHPEDL